MAQNRELGGEKAAQPSLGSRALVVAETLEQLPRRIPKASAALARPIRNRQPGERTLWRCRRRAPRALLGFVRAPWRRGGDARGVPAEVWLEPGLHSEGSCKGRAAVLGAIGRSASRVLQRVPEQGRLSRGRVASPIVDRRGAPRHWDPLGFQDG